MHINHEHEHNILHNIMIHNNPMYRSISYFNMNVIKLVLLLDIQDITVYKYMWSYLKLSNQVHIPNSTFSDKQVTHVKVSECPNMEITF